MRKRGLGLGASRDSYTGLATSRSACMRGCVGSVVRIASPNTVEGAHWLAHSSDVGG